MESPPNASRLVALYGYLWVPAAVVCLLFVLARSSAAPYWDQLTIAHFLASTFERGYPLVSELVAQHNESRKLFPRLLFWLLALPNHWDVRREMLAHVSLLVFGAVLLTSLARRTLPPGPAAVASAVGGTLLFSLSQWQNLLWGIQVVTSIPTVMLLLAMWVLTGPAGRLSQRAYVGRLSAAIVAAFVANYSYASGMALWLLLLPVVLLSPAPSSTWRWGGLTAMALAATASLTGYFMHYTRPADHPPADVVLSFPLAGANYFLAFLGNGLRVAAAPDPARLLGGLLLMTSLLAAVSLYTVAIARRTAEPLRQALPWLTLIAYTLLSAAATTAGRLAFGLQTAVSERYVTFALPLAIGVLPAAYLAARWLAPARRQHAAMVLSAAAASLLTLHVLATTHALHESRRFVIERRQGLAVATWLDVAPNGPEAQLLLFPVPNEARAVLRRLRDQGRLAFPMARSDRVSAYLVPNDAHAVSLGHLDAVRRTARRLTLAGWAVSPSSVREPADAILLSIEQPDGDARLVAMTALTRRHRPDVPAVAGSRYTDRCGWSLDVNLDETGIPDNARLAVYLYDQRTHTLRPLPDGTFPLPDPAADPSPQATSPP